MLVVEDNADTRETLRELLGQWGHHVEVAEDGPRGIEKALAMQPDTALIDIGLPGHDGYEIARRLRAAEQHIFLIAVTGYGQPDDRRMAVEAGFDAHLVKPVDLQELSQLLNSTSSPRAGRSK